MQPEPINFSGRKILIAPLDWGLGHATRCIPLIKLLQDRGCTTIFAGTAVQTALIKKEFLSIETVEIKGYNISYTKSKRWFALKILTQVPKILSAIRLERKLLAALVKKYRPDLVISDNRYGFHHRDVPCVFITHQLRIMAPFAWLERMLERINYSYIEKFTQCWVPDFEGQMNIAGRLSHPAALPGIPVKYLGSLSRFTYRHSTAVAYKFLFLVSGPEPQRTLLEEKVLSVLPGLEGKVLLVRGKPVDTNTMTVPSTCEVYNHLDTATLQEKMAESEFVISRSGYTTVMEILAMRKKALLIPTPGQTEQEYLATQLATRQCCAACRQEDDLLLALQQLEQFNFHLPLFHDNTGSVLDEALKELLTVTN